MVKIAGKKTDADWHKLKSKINADFGNIELWKQALDFFECRLNTRYIWPAESIQKCGGVSGEGFAITALLCSLVETLETFYQGKCYKYDTHGTKFEYGNGNSESLYLDFLTKRTPFCKVFDKTLAKDFYKNVRCALLHEAMTRNGWTIRIDTDELVQRKDDKQKILNRDYFLKYIKCYMLKYRESVLTCKERKCAFIRKMDCLCENTS